MRALTLCKALILFFIAVFRAGRRGALIVKTVPIASVPRHITLLLALANLHCRDESFWGACSSACGQDLGPDRGDLTSRCLPIHTQSQHRRPKLHPEHGYPPSCFWRFSIAESQPPPS